MYHVWDKAVPLSVINFVGRYACLVTMLLITFAVLTAVGLDTGYASAYLENTSYAVKMFSMPLLGESSAGRSFCMASAGLDSHTGILMTSDVTCELSIVLS